jgi:uncharacterized membrane protein YfcA
LIGSVILLGVLHGLSPEHGWPIAVTYALRHRKKIVIGALSGFVLGCGHLLSSIVVVLLFLWIGKVLNPPEEVLKGIGGVFLIALGIREFFHTHSHKEEPSKEESLSSNSFLSLLSLAVVLGFVHEEEFQILSICAGEISHCFWMIVLYASTVVVSLTGITVVVVGIFQVSSFRIKERVLHYITSGILLFVGISFLLSALFGI